MATTFIQCPCCDYVLPYVDGEVLFGEERFTVAQFRRLHATRIGCRKVQPRVLTEAELTAQLEADGIERTPDGTWRHRKN